jgi:hypothetical protein
MLFRSFLVVTALGLASCASSERPTATRCSPECEATQTECLTLGGTCVCKRTADDPANCGGCGIACAPGQSCRSGACMGTPMPRTDGGGLRDAGPGIPGMCMPLCSSSQRCCGTTCVGRTAPSALVDARSDPSFMNCGECGRACDPMTANACGAAAGGMVGCVCGGAPACSGGTQCVMNSTGAFQCLSTMNDPNNCGEIGRRCATGETCSAGRCVCGASACAAGQSCCGGTCVTTDSDPNNCGACGRVCDFTGPTCTGGMCRCGAGVACRAPGAPPFGDAGESCCAGSCQANTNESCGCSGAMCTEDTTCVIGGGIPFPGFPPGTMGPCCGIPIFGICS